MYEKHVTERCLMRGVQMRSVACAEYLGNAALRTAGLGMLSAARRGYVAACAERLENIAFCAAPACGYPRLHRMSREHSARIRRANAGRCTGTAWRREAVCCAASGSG